MTSTYSTRLGCKIIPDILLAEMLATISDAISIIWILTCMKHLFVEMMTHPQHTSLVLQATARQNPPAAAAKLTSHRLMKEIHTLSMLVGEMGILAWKMIKYQSPYRNISLSCLTFIIFTDWFICTGLLAVSLLMRWHQSNTDLMSTKQLMDLQT